MGDKGEVNLEIRGNTCWGNLFRLTVELHDIQGNNLSVPATVFIPNLRPGQIWDMPSIIGFTGFLDRFRFAIDPEKSRFYFGALGEIE